ncbi:MAG: 4Fe-4S binding protein [Planctomycetota bacterium]|nr:4Fe-4S binding protein [Planctomycetota bacterium]
MRLDIFLPFLRKAHKKFPLKEPGLLIRAATCFVPRALLSDHEKPKAGPIRRLLKKTGLTWLSSPLRRITQAICFILFLVLFFHTCWPYSAQPVPRPETWPSHYAEELQRKEWLEAELFLIIDPLVSISTAIAAKTWIWPLWWAIGILSVCVFIPRGFCGFLCPLGTLIDLFDWAIGKRVGRFKVEKEGWWVHLKYYILLGCLVASLCGVLLTGFVAAIPVITRGMLMTLAPLQVGLAREWHQIPAFNAGHIFSLVLFFAVLGLGLFRKRFWCRYVCPSGAIFSVFNFFRASDRKVESTCIHCNKCIEICPFDAIKADFTTRTADCTLCQTCGGVCPTHAIKFVSRGDKVDLKIENDPPANERAVSRRGFIGATAAGTALFTGISHLSGANLNTADNRELPVRPPGSVPEKEFLQLCIRCGECMKACPNDVLQPMGFKKQGLEGLWTPEVVANWAGCEPSCNICTQVCPTAAIRPIPLEEKRCARIGLADVNKETCLPYAGKEACQLCVDECSTAGYKAIEFERVHVEVDEDGMPLDDSGYVAPVVLPEKCVGCGLCQTRCHVINVKEKKKLAWTAIEIFAGEGREDRLMTGSYKALRDKERNQREAEMKKREEESGTDGTFNLDFLDGGNEDGDGNVDGLDFLNNIGGEE